MATFKIYRNEYTPAQINTLCSVDGNLVFDRSTSRIYCGIDNVTNSANLFGSNVQDVVYNTAGRMLTITYCDGSHEDVTIDKITGYTTPIYPISSDTAFDTVMSNNTIQNNDTYQTAINKLDTKSKTIVDSIINDESVILEGFAAVKDNVGLDNFFRYHSGKPTLQGVTTVSDAIDSLADYLVVVNTLSAGLAPHVTNTGGFLRGDGSWSLPSGYELTSNKVTVINSNSTNIQYPSAKCVYDNIRLKPVVVWKADTLANGILAAETKVSSNPTWQLTNLDMSDFQTVEVYIRAGGDSDITYTSSAVIKIDLDDLNKGPLGHFIGSTVVQNPNDRNCILAVTAVVSEDKTSVLFSRCTSLYGTGATDANNKNRVMYKIVGYYD